jgi:hypothetical protein
VLGLGDQQLLTGSLLLPIALYNYYWPTSKHLSFYYAANLAYFSSITHAATLIALRQYFRRYFWMTLFRLILTGTGFILWAYVAIEDINNAFNHGAGEVIKFAPTTGGILLAEIVGLAWIYWSVGLSLHVSEKALLARVAVGKRRSRRNIAAVQEWLDELEENDSRFGKTLSRVYDVYAHSESAVLRGTIW